MMVSSETRVALDPKLTSHSFLLPITMDPDYYSPEVSYRFHGAMSFAANRARDEFFLKRQIAGIVPPHSTTTGFVYDVLDAGVKYAHIVIAGNNRVETFDFAPPPLAQPVQLVMLSRNLPHDWQEQRRLLGFAPA